MRSGELAKQLGVSPDTLRLYERKGLLQRPPRSENGYRSYPPEAVDRIRVIRAALSIGFTIDELAEIFALRDRGGAPCQQVREMAGAKLKNLERQVQALNALRDQVRTVLQQWDKVLKKTPQTQRASLLEALAAGTATGARSLPLQMYSNLKSKSLRKEPRK
ncbi:MAG: heavy metal-responsive transcriptional regulator [Acidobacteriia bacterium]|nr:heavy metal-responsive transcriptional regulator [Terriglobia bacterium]